MKTALFCLFALLAGSIQAQAASLICAAGTLGSDDRIEVEISETELEIIRHETSLRAPISAVDHSGNTYALLEKPVMMAAEGEESTPMVNALIVYNPAVRQLTLTLMVDAEVQLAAVELSCP